MKSQRWLKLQLQMAIVAVSLLQRGCRPWTGPSANRGTYKATPTHTRLYYSENVTSSLFSRSSSSNQTAFSLKGYAFAETSDYFDSILFNDDKRQNKHASSLPTMASRRSSTSTAIPQQESFRHAIDHVHGIMDLYELTPSISSDIVTTALDGVIHKAFQDKVHLNCDSCALEELELLVRRCGKLQLPLGSIMSVKMLLTMQKQAHEMRAPQSSDPEGQYVDTATKLLLQYCQGSMRQEVKRQRSFLWPNEDLRSIFSFARKQTVGMSESLWELFEYVHQHHPDEALAKEIRRECFEILAVSEVVWSDRQYALLIDLDQLYQETNSTRHRVGTQELLLALSSAATSGDALQATWLFRKVYPRVFTSEEKKQLWCLLMEAYSQSNEAGSIEYMQQLVLLQGGVRHRDMYNIALKARAKQRSPGSGLLAEEFLKQMERLSDEATTNEAHLKPNMESVYHVASAYLDEEPLTYQNVADADILVRRLYSTYNITRFSGVRKQSSKSWPTFERLLNAYASLAFDDPKAIPAVEDLCRFFLLQHRDGRIWEHPTSKHLGPVLVALNRLPNQQNTETSVEFFRLFEKLENPGVKQVTITVENTLLLLDTLAKSGLRTYDDFARELFERALAGKNEPKTGLIEKVSHFTAQCKDTVSSRDQSHQS